MIDVERVADALKDVQAAYYCPPFDPYMIQGAVAFEVAAKEARLEHIVGLTHWLASPSHPSLMTRQLWLVDRLFSMTPGIAHTIVNPGFFADAYLAMTGLPRTSASSPGSTAIVALEVFPPELFQGTESGSGGF
jgi:hypothetical protein